MQTNEVAVKETNAIISAEDLAEWGAKEVTSNDLVIPQILVMQGLSVMVTDGKAQIGEFRDSLTEKLIGRYDTAPFEIIPFQCQEVFAIYAQDQASGNYLYHSTEPIIKSPLKSGYNDNLPWEDKILIDGAMTPIKRIRRYNFFVLLPKEIESGELVMPYFISFKSTSVKEGKKLFNMMYVRNVAAGLAPAAYTFTIAGKKEKNEKGTYIVPTVTQSDKTKPEHLKLAFDWFKRLSKASVKLHEEGEETPAAADTSATGDY